MKKIAVFLIMFLVLASAPLPEDQGAEFFKEAKGLLNELKRRMGNSLGEAFADTDDRDYFLIQGDSKIPLSKESGFVYTLKDDSIDLSLMSAEKANSGKTQAVKNASVSLNSAGGKVVSAKVIAGSQNATSAVSLKRLGAGSEMISGRLEIPGVGIYNFNFYVKVDLSIDRTPVTNLDASEIGFINKLFTTDLENNHLLMPTVGETYQIRLKGYKKTLGAGDPTLDYSATRLNWVAISNEGESNESVLKIDRTTGKVTANGAGITDLKVEAADDPIGKVKSDKISVIVPLRMSISDGSVNGNYANFTDNVNKGTIALDSNNEKVLYTNMVNPEDLLWEVKRTADGKDAKDFISITNVTKKTENKASSLKLVAKRAGTYQVKARLKNIKSTYKENKLTFVEFTLKVPLVKNERTIYMNVGDSYNIYNNSNIGMVTDYRYAVEGNSDAVTVDQSTSVIRAVKKGNAKVAVSDDRGVQFRINVEVIDTLSLNANSITIPVGGSFNLTAVSTDYSTNESWRWVSDNKSIAKVDGKGIQGTVTGMAAGDAVITVEHTVGGITKTATCRVRVVAGITKIRLTPEEKTVNVGDVVSFKADFVPESATGTYILWRSSNPNIVKINDENEHSSANSVTALSPGVAVIMAVNRENVVLGSAIVTVRTAVTGISLSDHVLEKALEEKSYQLKAVLKPAEATGHKLLWSSTNPNVATVDENGLITFKSAGHAGIICTLESDPKKMATCDLTVTKSVAALKLDKNEISLGVGETYKLTTYIFPDDASNRNLIFKSIDPKVATVSNLGMITAKQPGRAYITVITPDGKNSASCVVHVTQKAIGLKLDASSLILDAGQTYALEASFHPKTTTETKIIWTSSDGSVAKVDARGRVTGVSAGTCIITATAKGGITAVCHVRVNQPVGSIEIDPKEYEMAVGEETELGINFDSDDVTNKQVKWKSSNTRVAKVDKNGIVKAISGGVAVITATADENGMRATSVITVQEPVSEITLNRSAYNLGLRKTFRLIAKIKSNSATKKKVRWTSSNKKAVTVNRAGVIFGKKPGYATIKAKATDGSKAEATCRVRVVREAGSLSISDSFLSMVTGETHRLKANIRPKTATYRTVRYQSENTNIAIVDGKGKITAIGAGKTKIVVTTKDNSRKKQVCIVQVREYIPSTGITLSNTSLTMGVGDKQSVLYSVSPNGTDDKVTWSSNNKASVRVNGNGVISGISPGAATVTATTSSGKTATVSVTVVGLNFYDLALEQYDTYRLSVLGEVKNVTWDSGNSAVATVVNGIVTAKKAGSCNIYARVNGALLSCRVTVREIR